MKESLRYALTVLVLAIVFTVVVYLAKDSNKTKINVEYTPVSDNSVSDDSVSSDNAISENGALIDAISVNKVFKAGINDMISETVSGNQFSADRLAVLSDEIQEYYRRACFVGDSVMVGYQYYAGAHADAAAAKSYFLAQYSTAIRHSVIDLEEDPYQPSFRGEKMNVWNATALMDIDKVFIMYGTNDLGVYSADKTYELYLELIDKIRETTPGVEIHLISMTPVCAAREGKGLNNANVNYFNQLLIDGANEHNYSYVSLNPGLCDEYGCLVPSYSTDSFVHQTTAAYGQVWDVVLKEYASQKIRGSYKLPTNSITDIYGDERVYMQRESLEDSLDN